MHLCCSTWTWGPISLSAFIQQQEFIPEHRTCLAEPWAADFPTTPRRPQLLLCQRQRIGVLGYDSPNPLRMSVPGGGRLCARRGSFLPRCWSLAARLSPRSSCLHLAEGIPQRLSLLLKTSYVGIFRYIGICLTLFACSLVGRFCLTTDRNIWFY